MKPRRTIIRVCSRKRTPEEWVDTVATYVFAAIMLIVVLAISWSIIQNC